LIKLSQKVYLNNEANLGDFVIILCHLQASSNSRKQQGTFSDALDKYGIDSKIMLVSIIVKQNMLGA